MKIHYFQRYHQKENVATANTMLLLSRLYSYSSDKFFRFLKSEFFSDSFEPEIVFNLQEKSDRSIPDATITQESFKIVVETKLSDWFYSDQLERHLKSFKDEKYKVMITLATELMDPDKKNKFEKKMKEHNDELRDKQIYPIMHVNTTFERIIEAIGDVIDDRDYEMQEVLDDYRNYCYKDNLIASSDSRKRMRMQLSGATFDFNVSRNLYFDSINRGFSPHDYLGLYKGKSIRAIGKINAIVTGVTTELGVEFKAELGELTNERREQIAKAIDDGLSSGYSMTDLRFFFVEKFYETDFKKVTPRAPMGTRVFDLSDILETEQLSSTEDIAEILKTKTWG